MIKTEVFYTQRWCLIAINKTNAIVVNQTYLVDGVNEGYAWAICLADRAKVICN